MLIGAVRSLLNEEKQQDQNPDQRDENDQKPPARAPQIMQTAYAHGDGWHQNGKRENQINRHQALISEEHYVDHSQDEAGDKAE